MTGWDEQHFLDTIMPLLAERAANERVPDDETPSAGVEGERPSEVISLRALKSFPARDLAKRLQRFDNAVADPPDEAFEQAEERLDQWMCGFLASAAVNAHRQSAERLPAKRRLAGLSGFFSLTRWILIPAAVCSVIAISFLAGRRSLSPREREYAVNQVPAQANQAVAGQPTSKNTPPETRRETTPAQTQGAASTAGLNSKTDLPSTPPRTGEVLEGIFRSPTLIWNESGSRDPWRCSTVSLSIPPSANLARSSEHYTHRQPPSFLTTAAIHDPTTAILAGSLIAFLLVFSALGFALVRSASAVTAVTALTFLFCGFLIVNSEGAFNTAFFIHTDAAALAFATVACSLVAGRNRITTAALWMSALACALAIASKQTIAPVALAIALYVAITEGGKRLASFLFALAVTGGSILAILLAVFPARAFLFNTFVLAAHRPLKPGYLQILADTYRAGRALAHRFARHLAF